MRTIILAAGEGSRLNASNKNLPKLFLEINGKTIFEYQLEALEAVTDRGLVDSTVSLVLGYGFEQDEKLERDIEDIVSPRNDFTFDPIYFQRWKDADNSKSALKAIKSLESNDHLLLLCGDIVIKPTQLERIASTFINEFAPHGFSAVTAYEGIQNKMTSVMWNDENFITDYGAIRGHREAGIFIIHEDHIGRAQSLWENAPDESWFPLVFTEIPTKPILLDNESEHLEINTDCHYNYAKNSLPF